MHRSNGSRFGDTFGWTKSELLLRHAALYFSSVDRLVADDQYEGSSDLSELEERKKYSDAVKAGCESFNRYPAPLHTMVNCWYGGEDESKAMWTLYANGKSASSHHCKTYVQSALLEGTRYFIGPKRKAG